MDRTPFIHILVLITFLANTFGPMPIAVADEFRLPAPGIMVHLSPPLDPPILKGIKVHPDNPFKFDFILDKGDNYISNNALKDESSKLVKYFLASLTVPEKDLWVNLSPYEKDRIVPNSFGQTEMGRDLLAEDYMLKQITASLIYPEDEVGKKFWKRIYEEAAKKFGTTDIPVNTFNKVWIVPEKAVVYENAKIGAAYVVESKLKVMLEQDYLSLQKHSSALPLALRNDMASVGANIVREIVIPELTKEVNEDKNFARLRQVYNSLILAIWYKNKIKDSILSQVYSDRNKIAGVNIDDPQEKQRIYQRYLRAFKKGVYNYIKENIDPVTQETIPRKYFSGGVNFEGIGNTSFNNTAMTTANAAQTADAVEKLENSGRAVLVTDTMAPSDNAMSLHKTPYRSWYESLTRGETTGFDEVSSANRDYSNQNKKFFGFFSGIRTALNGHHESNGKLIEELRAREAKYYDTHGGVANFFENDHLIHIQWLFNAYKSLSSWEDMARIYEEANKKEYGRNDFTDLQYVQSDYDLALNRMERLTDSLNFLIAMKSRLEEKNEKPIDEMYINFGTVYKDLWAAKQTSAPERFLAMSYQSYLKAYQSNDSYYAGINVVRTLIYQGQFQAAKEMGKLVYHSAIAAHNKKSFWVVATLLELALLNGDASTVEQLLPTVKELSNGGGELTSLLEHLNRWYAMENSEHKQLLDHAITELDPQKIGSHHQRNGQTVTDFVEKVAINLGRFLRIEVMPNNMKGGGAVADAIVSVADREVAKMIVEHPIEEGEFVPEKGAPGKSLADIDNVEDADKWIDSYIEWLFGLKNANGERTLEYLKSADHEMLDEFFAKYKLLSGFDVFERGSDATTGADNVTMTAMAGRGDCRPTHFFKNLLFDVWNRMQRESLRQDALNSFEEALNAYEHGDHTAFVQYDEAFSKYEGKEDHQFGYMQVLIYTNTEGKTMYDIPLASDNKSPIRGNGLVVYQNKHGEKEVLINEKNPDYTLYANLEEVRDDEGGLLGYRHPYLEIRRQEDGSEYLFRKENDPAIKDFIKKGEGKIKVSNRNLIAINDIEGNFLGVKDTTLMLVRNSTTNQEEIFRITEDHTSGVEIIYDHHGEVTGLEFRDTWYKNDGADVSDDSGFYRYNHRRISLTELQQFMVNGKVQIPKAIKVYNPQTQKLELHDLVMAISPFSDLGRILNSNRYPAENIHRGSQTFFNLSNPDDRQGMMKVLFVQDTRNRITELNKNIAAEWHPNPAMSVEKGDKEATRGGIDFTANRTSLEIQNAGERIKFHLDPAQLAQLQNTSGFMPVIINIQPMTDLKSFLGLNEQGMVRTSG